MDLGFVLVAADFAEKPTDEMISEYRSLIGSIGFAAVARPNPKLINEAKRVIRFLIKNRNFSIKWSGSGAPMTRIGRVGV